MAAMRAGTLPMKNPPKGGLLKKKPAGWRAKGSEEDSEETLAEKQKSENQDRPGCSTTRHRSLRPIHQRL